MKLVVAQVKLVAGDFQGNISQMIEAYHKAEEEKADIIVFPELSITGYNNKDNFLRNDFIAKAIEAQNDFLKKIEKGECAAIFGNISICDDSEGRIKLYNSAFVSVSGKIIGVHHKKHLPNYTIFEEKRYFYPGEKSQTVVDVLGLRIGVMVCEDLWNADDDSEKVDFIISLNASPFSAQKFDVRLRVARNVSKKFSAPVVYVNSIAGEDEILFDGGSFIYHDAPSYSDIHMIKKDILKENMVCDFWSQDMRAYSFSKQQKRFSFLKKLIGGFSHYDDYHDSSCKYTSSNGVLIANYDSCAANLYLAIVTGLKDYLAKCGFDRVVIPVSGGIDSALVFAIACDALGKDKVLPLYMPSAFTTKESSLCIKALSERHQKEIIEVSIAESHAVLGDAISIFYQGKERFVGDKVNENIQPRIRGVIAMALSNKVNGLLLSCGNKSEAAVGYTTIYGDSCGGVAPIGDLYKTDVYRIAVWRNKISDAEKFTLRKVTCNDKLVDRPIPDEIIGREPSAELSIGQKDSDTLPKYEELDLILRCIIEDRMNVKEAAISTSLEIEKVSKVWKMWKCSEFKRRQGPFSFKLSESSLDQDIRYPV